MGLDPSIQRSELPPVLLGATSKLLRPPTSISARVGQGGAGQFAFPHLGSRTSRRIRYVSPLHVIRKKGSISMMSVWPALPAIQAGSRTLLFVALLAACSRGAPPPAAAP